MVFVFQTWWSRSFFTGERGDVQSEGIVVLTTGKVFLSKVAEGSLVFLWQFQGVFSPQCSSEKACSFLSKHS